MAREVQALLSANFDVSDDVMAALDA